MEPVWPLPCEPPNPGFLLRMLSEKQKTTEAQWSGLPPSDPVDEMRLFSVRADQVNDPLANYETHVDGDSVIVSNDEERYFRCVARGANPPAAVTVTYNDNDITDQVRRGPGQSEPLSAMRCVCVCVCVRVCACVRVCECVRVRVCL